MSVLSQKIFALNLAAPPDQPSIMGDGLHYTLRRLNVPTVSHQFSDSVAKTHTALIRHCNPRVKPVVKTHKAITDG